MKNEPNADAKRFLYLATAISALGGMLFGYDIGVISGAVLFIRKAFSLSPGLEEIVVSSSIGAWLFAFFLVPETKGKTLEQIEAHWRTGKQPRAL